MRSTLSLRTAVTVMESTGDENWPFG
jgi:hypothetical protein